MNWQEVKTLLLIALWPLGVCVLIFIGAANYIARKGGNS
jgi:hypothetical protein